MINRPHPPAPRRGRRDRVVVSFLHRLFFGSREHEGTRSPLLNLDRLEDRCTPASIAWTNASGGDWFTATNWSTNTIPTANDDVSIGSNAGYIVDVASSGAVAKTLTVSGTLRVSGGDLTVSNWLRASGDVELSGGTINSSTEFSINKGGEFVWSGGSFVGTPTANTGTVEITAGATASGTIAIRSATTFRGQVNDGQTLDLSGTASNSLRIFTPVTNYGEIRLAPSGTGYQRIEINSAGELTNASTGEIVAASGGSGARYLDGTFVNQGTVTVDAGTTLKVRKLTTGDEVTLESGSVSVGTGGLVSVENTQLHVEGGTVSGEVALLNTKVDSATSVSSPVSLLIRDTGNILLNNLSPLVELVVQGNASSSAYITVTSAGVTNAGTITLESAGTSRNAVINVGGGASLTNSTTGVINVVLGAGGTRQISGSFTNDGTLNLEHNLTIAQKYTSNSGTIDLGGHTLTISGTSLTNESGGSIIGPGTITGAVINNGTISIGGASPGTLTISGAFTQGSGGTLALRVVSGSSFDVLAVTGKATLAGTLAIERVDGYVPAVDEDIAVITYGSYVGSFGSVTGLDEGGTPVYGVLYNGTNFKLESLT